MIVDFNQKPENISEKEKTLREQLARYTDKVEKAKSQLSSLNRTTENKQIYNLGRLFQQLNWLWVDNDVALGLIKEQIDKADKERIEYWSNIGKEYNANANALEGRIDNL